jgi:ligand-binding SRPBCC domain-containing protein
MKIFHFECGLWLPRPRKEVFEFFANALNLEEITPSWLKFRVVTPNPIHMQLGTEIEYRLRIRDIPVRWQSRITVWDPPHRFVDEQIRGPYRAWIHEHRFTEQSRGTLCEDSVQYTPFGGTLINKLLVEGDIRKIFAYRSERLQEFFQELREDELSTRNDGDVVAASEPTDVSK